MSESDSGSLDTLVADAEAPTTPSPAVGEVFADRYEIVRELGRGGMGVVFVARDQEVGENIALKLLAPNALSPMSLERFRLEVRLARHVTHRCVARTFDIGQHGGLHYLTMELVDGENLDQLLVRRDRLSPTDAASLGAQLCEGLAAAHDAGVVHRDLKPANVLIDRAGRAVITDFGIARSIDAGAGVTVDGAALVGTPAFMAPEQVRGQTLSPQTDLYAMGLILYRAIAGRLPFDAQDGLAAAVARLDEEPTDPRRLAAVPDELAELILQCLAVDPAKRPESARALGRSLAAFAHAVQPAAPPDTSRPFAAVSPGDRSLAILPFRYRGPPDSAYLGEALTEELIDVLSMTRGLKVCSGGATEAFAENRDPKAVAAALGVEALVDGTLEVAGERLRIRVRLIDAATGIQSWSERFDSQVRDVFRLEDEIARRVAETLRLHIETRTLTRSVPTEAVDLYLQGRAKLNQPPMRSGPPGPAVAAEYLERALDLAPDFKPALPALAQAYLGAWFAPGSLGGNYGPRARAAVDDALQRAADIPETHLAAARFAVQEGRFVDAAAALKRALEMAPTYGSAHDYLGMLQLECGRPQEGRRRVELALELDSRLELGLGALARHFALHGDEAGLEGIRNRRLSPGAHFILGMLEVRRASWRQDADAVKAITSRLAETFGPRGQPPKRLFETMIGGPPAADLHRNIADAFGANQSPRGRAFVLQLTIEAYAGRGATEQALDYLQQLEASAFTDLDWLDHCPALDGIRCAESFAGVRATIERRANAIWTHHPD